MTIASLEVSVVAPCHNERDNLPRLLETINRVFSPLGREYEVVITDDCSDDGSWDVLRSLAEKDPRLRIQRLAGRGGQSVALWAGIRAARGKIIVTIDADMQNDPADLPLLLDGLRNADCVCGSRVEARRQGDNWVRRASSRIANGVRNRLSGETISDAGCCYRAFRRECVADIKFFRGGHRFLPTLIKMEGFTVTEIPIRHHPRTAGKAHYGVWNRLFSSFADLLAVRWMKQRYFKYRIADKIPSE
jgi:dolichol-phosphate mannosyltransferase